MTPYTLNYTVLLLIPYASIVLLIISKYFSVYPLSNFILVSFKEMYWFYWENDKFTSKPDSGPNSVYIHILSEVPPRGISFTYSIDIGIFYYFDNLIGYFFNGV